MERHPVALVLFSALTITGVMTLNLQSNDSIPERGEGLQLSCLLSEEFMTDTILWINPQNVKLSTCHAIYKQCTGNSSSYSYTADNKGAYAYIHSLSRMQDNGTWKCLYKNTTANTEIIVYTSPVGVQFVQPIPPDRDLGVESLTLICQTDNCCYPAPNIAWYYRTSTGQTALYQWSSGSLSSNTDTCIQSEVTYTSTLQLPRGTTFIDNIPLATKFVCGVHHVNLTGDMKYSVYSNNVTFAVNLTSLTLRDSNGNDLPNIAELVNGTAVNLMCVSSTSRPTATVNWYIENMGITSGINNVVKTGNNGLDYIESWLTFIPSNTEHHKKMIYCQAYSYTSSDFLQSVKSMMFVKVQVVGTTLYDSTSAFVASVLPVVDGVPTTLRCETTLSRPASTTNWYKGGSVIHDNVTTTNLTSNGLDYVRSTLNLTPSNSDHEQVIYCQAYNIDPMVRVTSIRATLNVTVYVKFITMSPSGSPLVFLEGIEKRFQCAASPSRPQPQVRWWLGAEHVMSPISESISNSGNLIVTTSVIRLTLNRSHAHKLLYCDTIVSGQQTWISSSKFDVDVKFTPEKPIHFHPSSVQDKQLSLMWQSGYHGGFIQTFVVDISLDNITWNNVSQVHAGNRDGWFFTVIADLIPESEYYFRLYAYNIIGRGNFADVQLAIRMLKEENHPIEVGASVGIGVGGVVGVGVGGFVIGLIIAIIAFTIRRQLNGPKKSCFSGKGKTDDAMHTYSNTEMNPETVKPVYEELHKRNVEQIVYDKISPL